GQSVLSLPLGLRCLLFRRRRSQHDDGKRRSPHLSAGIPGDRGGPRTNHGPPAVHLGGTDEPVRGVCVSYRGGLSQGRGDSGRVGLLGATAPKPEYALPYVEGSSAVEESHPLGSRVRTQQLFVEWRKGGTRKGRLWAAVRDGP